MTDTNSPQVIVIAPAWVGDFIMAQSLFQIIKRRVPTPEIDLIAPLWTASLATRMPEIRTTWNLAIPHGAVELGARLRLGRKLRSINYEQAIILPNSFKAALVPYIAGIVRRSGYLGELRWGLLNDIRAQFTGRTVERFVTLGVEPGMALPTPIPNPRLVPDRGHAHATLIRLGVTPPDSPVVALCPGAEYGPAKRWPVEHFAQVARQAAERGWDVWIFGSTHDAVLSEEIQRLSHNAAVNLAGRTTLPEAIDLLSLAEAVVTNDSGLMHIAAALDLRIVALFGSSDPRHTPPLSVRAQILRRDLPCSPCFRRNCPYGHLRCLWEITPAEVCAVLFN